MFRTLSVVALTALSFCTAIGDAQAQYFGRNKVEYIDFDFKIFETEHFDVYGYPHEEAAARLAARLAERWYARLSRVLQHELSTRQPLILYGSHPEFAQTNVVAGFLDEGIGGVTDGARRRIVMPFGPTMEETDRVLGHEIVHAFQMDMLRRHGGRYAWPRWAIEGMAQYLALGATDPSAVMWLRDAVAHDLLPERQRDAAGRFSPYRYGHAMWAYLAGRFGDRVLGDALRSGRSGNFDKRMRAVTGVGLDQLFTEWRAAAHAQYGPAAPVSDARNGAVPLLRDRGPGGRGTSRIHLGPALSPDGRQAIFFSERDRLSLDLFLADTDTGRVRRRLARLAASETFESFQAIRSAAAWNPAGDRVVFAAVAQGRPSLVVLDVGERSARERVEQSAPADRSDRSRVERTIRFPQFGQILTPSWSPDGRQIAFSVLDGGATDVYIYDLGTQALRRVTNDLFADLQPVWSPDGTQIAFVTDRFSSDLTSLQFGPGQLALVDVASGAVQPLPMPARGLDAARHVNPQWSRGGESLYFTADPGGISNVYRLDLATHTVAQVTSVASGVTGMIDNSPALSVARDAPALAFSEYEKGQYRIRLMTDAAALAGRPLETNAHASSNGNGTADAAADAGRGGGGAAAAVRARALQPLPPIERVDDLVQRLLRDDEVGLAAADAVQARDYRPVLSLDRIGQPYVSSGGGPLGGFVRAGGALGFGDLLGGRRLSTSVQVGGRMRDVEIGVHFLNRQRRWNWGALVELEPSLRRVPRRQLDEVDGEQALRQDTVYFQRIQLRAAGLLAYPLSHARRLEFTAGVRYARHEREMRSRVMSLETGRKLDESRQDWYDGSTAVGEVSAALVGDTAVVGPTSPILGSRYRFEVAPAVGGLSSTRVLLDYRRYAMPAKPYTMAARVVHLGLYGPDADDPRVLPTFLGSRYFVRGYGWSSLRCEWDAQGNCAALEDLLGSRLLATNLELRVPLFGMLSRDIRYGPVPAEGFLFADAGTVWSQRAISGDAGTGWRTERRLVRSAGAGVRVNAIGIPLELAAVHAFDEPARGWSFDFSFRAGF